MTLWSRDFTVVVASLTATIWLFTPSIQYRFLPSQSTATESARTPVETDGVTRLHSWSIIIHLDKWLSPKILICAIQTFDQRSCGLLVQRGPPDALSVQTDPEDPLFPPVVVQGQDGLLGRGGQHIKVATAQAKQEEVCLDWWHQEGFAWGRRESSWWVKIDYKDWSNEVNLFTEALQKDRFIIYRRL